MNFSICVVTGFTGANYGTKLQSMALCKYFEKLGYDTVILDRFKVPLYFVTHPSILKTRLLNRINRKQNMAFFNPSPYAPSEKRKKRLADYEKENYNALTIDKWRSWKKILKDKPCFVVGSDIIWQPSFGIPGKWFLDFTYKTGVKKFSYATSIGANELPRQYYKYYKKYLGEFTAVSVREKKAAHLLEPIIGREVNAVIDPTLLHDTDFWDQYAKKAEIPENIESGKYILCYFVMDDSRYWNYIKLVQDETGMQVVVLPMHYTDEQTPYVIMKEGTPYEFVWLIKNAAFICTDSFHACAFSLNYQKEFYLLRRARKDEDAKYDDFLVRYGLEARNVNDEGVFTRNKNIDYITAHKLLQLDRQFAYNFIQKALKD